MFRVIGLEERIAAVRDGISRFFSAQLKLDVSSIDTELFETGVLDSLVFVELLVHLENEFGVTVSIDALELDDFRSIRRIADLVVALQGVRPAMDRPTTDVA